MKLGKNGIAFQDSDQVFLRKKASQVMGDGLVHTDMCDYVILSKNNNKYVSEFCCISEYNQSMGYLYNIHQVFTPINVKSVLTPGAQ